MIKVFENKSGTRRCEFIKRDELAQLIESLKNKKREEEVTKEAAVKLKSVWAIGDAVVPYAKAVAENVREIAECDPRIIAELAKADKPKAILWNADLWGRKNAPIAAALLKTGLCRLYQTRNGRKAAFYVQTGTSREYYRKDKV